LADNDLTNIILVGHSYGGMIITGVADSAPGRIRRLVYWNAFVPNNGESVIDMLPPQYVALFDSSVARRGKLPPLGGDRRRKLTPYPLV
jgi:pimeloyl-ACP methyl ester carboxylesterase